MSLEDRDDADRVVLGLAAGLAHARGPGIVHALSRLAGCGSLSQAGAGAMALLGLVSGIEAVDGLSGMSGYGLLRAGLDLMQAAGGVQSNAIPLCGEAPSAASIMAGTLRLHFAEAVADASGRDNGRILYGQMFSDVVRYHAALRGPSVDMAGQWLGEHLGTAYDAACEEAGTGLAGAARRRERREACIRCAADVMVAGRLQGECNEMESGRWASRLLAAMPPFDACQALVMAIEIGRRMALAAGVRGVSSAVCGMADWIQPDILVACLGEMGQRPQVARIRLLELLLPGYDAPGSAYNHGLADARWIFDGCEKSCTTWEPGTWARLGPRLLLNVRTVEGEVRRLGEGVYATQRDDLLRRCDRLASLAEANGARLAFESGGRRGGRRLA